MSLGKDRSQYLSPSAMCLAHCCTTLRRRREPLGCWNMPNEILATKQTTFWASRNVICFEIGEGGKWGSRPAIEGDGEGGGGKMKADVEL
jgi:hypothetical protein